MNLSQRAIYLTNPQKENYKLNFEDIFDIEELQKIQDAFATATGLGSIITDLDGRPITRPSNFCRLCTEIIRGTEKGLANCMKSNSLIGKSFSNVPVSRQCFSGGLWDGGAVICVGDQHIANWLIGQVLLEEADEQEILKYAKEIGADEGKFKSALAEVTRMPKDQFEKICDALFLIARQFSTLAVKKVEQAHHLTERKRAEETIRYLAYHDALTGLPNRTLFNDRLNLALEQAHRSREKLAVLFLDLDRFKLVNDTLGHAMGDRLLKEVAKRLISCLPKGNTVARLGGDEFTIILPKVTRLKDVVKSSKKILEGLKPSFNLEGQEAYITTSLGVSLYPSDGEDSETLLKNADTAMYKAKERGRNNYQFYTPAMNAKALKQLTLENRLHRAIEQEEFVVYYQPQVELRNGEIIGVEALTRWQHPELGLLPPSDFIPLAEETGLIIPLGEWVLRKACTQNKIWQDGGLGPLRVAVNLSVRQFQQSDLVETVAAILKETGIEPQWLELEITESMAMQDLDFTIKILAELRKMGIQISIDDFGSGYSFLNSLKKLPIHALKIDQSFISELTIDSQDAAIANAVIVLAHSLGLEVTAEGVETQEQLSFLKEQRCDKMQGYLFSRPIAADSLEKLLKGEGKDD